jgi:hypothetical protein
MDTFKYVNANLSLPLGKRRHCQHQPASCRCYHDKALPVGRHPPQLYFLGTPGVKVTLMLEESCWQPGTRARNTTPG